MTRYRYEDELPFVAEKGGGLMLPQVFAWDFGEEQVRFTDDLIFAPGKQGLLQLLVLINRSEGLADALLEIEGTSNLTRGRVREDEATVLIHSFEARVPCNTNAITVARIATGAEFAADKDLSRDRPPPDGYDAFKLRREIGKAAKFVVLRPDRVVYAACASGAELKKALGRIDADLHVRSGASSGCLIRSSL